MIVETKSINFEIELETNQHSMCTILNKASYLSERGKMSGRGYIRVVARNGEREQTGRETRQDWWIVYY